MAASLGNRMHLGFSGEGMPFEAGQVPADGGDSAQISSSFIRLSIFLAGRLRRPRPSAGNANRCAAPRKLKPR
jgi:hypothetical protein